MEEKIKTVLDLLKSKRAKLVQDEQYPSDYQYYNNIGSTSSASASASRDVKMVKRQQWQEEDAATAREQEKTDLANNKKPTHTTTELVVQTHVRKKDPIHGTSDDPSKNKELVDVDKEVLQEGGISSDRHEGSHQEEAPSRDENQASRENSHQQEAVGTGREEEEEFQHQQQQQYGRTDEQYLRENGQELRGQEQQEHTRETASGKKPTHEESLRGSSAISEEQQQQVSEQHADKQEHAEEEKLSHEGIDESHSLTQDHSAEVSNRPSTDNPKGEDLRKQKEEMAKTEQPVDHSDADSAANDRENSMEEYMRKEEQEKALLHDTPISSSNSSASIEEEDLYLEQEVSSFENKTIKESSNNKEKERVIPYYPIKEDQVQWSSSGISQQQPSATSVLSDALVTSEPIRENNDDTQIENNNNVAAETQTFKGYGIAAVGAEYAQQDEFVGGFGQIGVFEQKDGNSSFASRQIQPFNSLVFSLLLILLLLYSFKTR